MAVRRCRLRRITPAENKNKIIMQVLTPYATRSIQAGILALLLHFYFLPSLQAGDVLTRPINVSFYQTPIKEAMAQIAQKGGFEWSYNANILDANKKVTLISKNKTIGETLHALFGTEYTFKQSGNYLILKKVKKPQERMIGYISDPKTGQKLSNVTVYDRQTLRSTTTDANGFYELPVTENSQVVIAKLAYRDTILQVNSQTPRFVQINIHLDTVPEEKDTWAAVQLELQKTSYKMERFFVSSAQKFTALNVKDSLHRRFQLSLLPMIGTNHLMSGNVTNNFSINLISGYSRGNDGVELAGLGNHTRENIRGLQAAGFYNEVRGNVTGVQLSGFYNRIGGTLRGVQAAGFVNMAKDAKGPSAQISGGFNIVPRGHFAIQAAGIANHADSIMAFQAAGLYNIGAAYMQGVQVAGLFNVAKKGNGALQAAGLFNTIDSGTMRVQSAGLFNDADTIRGAQIAGLYNRARKVKGVQIGLINWAREIDGMQIGLLNFSKKGGYVTLELSGNEVTWSNVAFKSGTRHLYTIFTAGYTPAYEDRKFLWSYGAGIGALARFNDRCGMSFDLIHRQINVEGRNNQTFHGWAQFAPAFDVRIAGGLHVALGLSANVYIAEKARPDGFDYKPLVVPANFPSIKIPDAPRLSSWVGGNVALRYQF